MKKIIILDIDGVLNVIPQGRDGYGAMFHPHLVDNLKRIVDATGGDLVISSTWRHSGLSVMKEMWEARKLPGKVIGVTPSRKDPSREHMSFKDRGERGIEIKEYLDNNPVEKYVIIDDDDDVLPEQEPYFVQTSFNQDHPDCIDDGYGLTSKCADRAIEILNS